MKQFVCTDDDGDWYYFPEEEKYERWKGEEVRGRIGGKYIPNPRRLLAARKLARPDAKEADLMPTEATYKLFEHWSNIVLAKERAANVPTE